MDQPFNPVDQIVTLVEASLNEGDTRDFDDVGDDPYQHEGDAEGGDSPPPADVDIEIIKANSALDQNDTDNGKRLLRLFGDRFLNVREIGLHAWEGRYWRLEGGDQEVERCAQETAKLMKFEAKYILPPPEAQAQIDAAKPLKEFDKDDLDEKQKAILTAGLAAEFGLKKRREGRRKFAISCGNRGRTMAMIAQAMPHRTVAPATLDADALKFNAANGTLIFEREERQEEDPWEEPPFRTVVVAKYRFAPHSRADLISKISGMAHDPAAKAPLWQAFLERFQPDEAQRRFLQVAAGRALIGGASTQALIFLYGDGANGKSVFMETLAQCFEDYAGRLKPESITGTMEQGGDKATPDFARLQGKRFVAIAELPRGAPLREGLVKTMTGSEPMPVRHLNHGFFDMTPEFIPFMSGNQMPEIGGLDKGIWRRLKFVKWPVTLAEAEQKPMPEVVASFVAENAGILNWLIEGALIFLREGLRDPPSVQELTQSHREDSDPVGAFIAACVTPSPGSTVQADFMYQCFKRWCEGNAVRSWSGKNFGLALKQKGFIREDKRWKVRHWMDVAVDADGLPSLDPQPYDGGSGGKY